MNKFKLIIIMLLCSSQVFAQKIAIYSTANTPQFFNQTDYKNGILIVNRTIKTNTPGFSVGTQLNIKNNHNVFVEYKKYSPTKETGHSTYPTEFGFDPSTSSGPETEYIVNSKGYGLMLGYILKIPAKTTFNYSRGIELATGYRSTFKDIDIVELQNWHPKQESHTRRDYNFSFSVMYNQELQIAKNLDIIGKIGISNTPVQLGLKYNLK